jgi:hypothetical protein
MSCLLANLWQELAMHRIQAVSAEPSCLLEHFTLPNFYWMATQKPHYLDYYQALPEVEIFGVLWGCRAGYRPRQTGKNRWNGVGLAYEEVDGYESESIFHGNGAKYGNAHGLL